MPVDAVDVRKIPHEIAFDQVPPDAGIRQHLVDGILLGTQTDGAVGVVLQVQRREDVALVPQAQRPVQAALPAVAEAPVERGLHRIVLAVEPGPGRDDRAEPAIRAHQVGRRLPSRRESRSPVAVGSWFCGR